MAYQLISITQLNTNDKFKFGLNDDQFTVILNVNGYLTYKKSDKTNVKPTDIYTVVYLKTLKVYKL